MNGQKNGQKTSKFTGQYNHSTSDPRPVLVFNATAITNRRTYGEKIPWVKAPTVLKAHVVPIPHTCEHVGRAVQHTLVCWSVLFPPLPKCRHPIIVVVILVLILTLCNIYIC